MTRLAFREVKIYLKIIIVRSVSASSRSNGIQVMHSFNNFTSDESLDVLLQNIAFKALLLQHRPHTGALYKASLPPSLSGMEISVARLRSKTLWSRGANFSNIHISLKTLPMPYVRRILVVCWDFGNWSSNYYRVPSYSLLSSVAGFMAYDASNVSSNGVTKLNLDTMGKPMEIQFRNLTFPQDSTRRRRCATFGADGMVYPSDVSTKNVCYSRDQGCFSIVAPLMGKQRVGDLWVSGVVLGFAGLVLVCVVGDDGLKSLLIYLERVI